MRSLSSIAILSVLLPSTLAATTYDMVKEYSGSTFFDGWDFYGKCAYDLLVFPWSFS